MISQNGFGDAGPFLGLSSGEDPNRSITRCVLVLTDDIGRRTQAEGARGTGEQFSGSESRNGTRFETDTSDRNIVVTIEGNRKAGTGEDLDDATRTFDERPDLDSNLGREVFELDSRLRLFQRLQIIEIVGT